VAVAASPSSSVVELQTAAASKLDTLPVEVAGATLAWLAEKVKRVAASAAARMTRASLARP
jgi:hypothetical protein